MIRHNNKDVNRKVVKNVKDQNRIEKLARELRNKKAQEWRKNNKEKVKEINRRYWLKRAEKELVYKE